jgi:hypothetical protein
MIYCFRDKICRVGLQNEDHECCMLSACISTQHTYLCVISFDKLVEVSLDFGILDFCALLFYGYILMFLRNVLYSSSLLKPM